MYLQEAVNNFSAQNVPVAHDWKQVTTYGIKTLIILNE
jgi:hypothetical protein